MPVSDKIVWSRSEQFTIDADGSLAQLVEQRPEEPRVPSSSLGGATKINPSLQSGGFILVTALLASNWMRSAL